MQDEGLWKLKHYQFFYKISKDIIDYFIHGKDKTGSITPAVFEKCFSLLLRIEKKLFELMKYALVGAGLEFHHNQLIQAYHQYRFLIANAYTYQSIVEQDQEAFGDKEGNETDDLVLEFGEV